MRRWNQFSPHLAPPDGGGDAAGEEKLSRKEREQARHTEEVLEAAEGLLVSTSYHDISVQQIAEAAEFSVGYLYKLFENKEGIYLSLLERRERDMVDAARSGIRTVGTFGERLLRMHENLFAWLERSPAFAGRNFRELSAINLDRIPPCERMTPEKAEGMDELNAFLREGIDSGELGDHPVDEMSIVIRAMLIGAIEGRRHMPEEYRKNLLEYPPILTRVFMRAYGVKEYND